MGYSPWGRKESEITEHAHNRMLRKSLKHLGDLGREVCSITEAQSTPKPDEGKPQFYYAHEFCGSAIWIEHTGHGLSLCYDVWGLNLASV